MFPQPMAIDQIPPDALAQLGSRVDVRVELDGMPVPYEERVAGGVQRSQPRTVNIDPHDGPTVTVLLMAIAHGRSGDKGPDVNIGIRARHCDFYPVLLRDLDADRVADYLAHLGARTVVRYELPGIQAVNFVLEDGLGAGGFVGVAATMD